MGKSVIIIPSRLAATRLPNKPLIKINNKSLIMHVYEKALRCELGEVYVATCDKEIASEIDKNGGKFIMTKNTHSTGTDRVYEASKKIDIQSIEYIINVQGDEPMINSRDIRNLFKVSKNEKLDFSTLAFKIKDKNQYIDKNIVKVLTENKISNSSTSKAITFSREIKSYTKNIYHHYGVYLYKPSILEKFIKLNQSKNEKHEKLEQLRAIDNKININVLLANHFSVGIDTEQDLDNYMKKMNKIT